MNKVQKIIELFILGISWGSGFMLIKVGLQYFTPFGLTTLRCALSGAMCLVIAGLKLKKTPWTMPPLSQLVLVAACTNAIPFTFCSFGEIYSHSATAGVIEGLIPLFTIMLSILFIKNFKIKKAQVLGIIFGLIGLLLMFITSFTDSVQSNEIGRTLLMGMALFFSLGFILGEMFLKEYDPIQLCAIQHLISGVLLLPFMFYFENPNTLFTAPMEGYQVMLILCLLNSCGWVVYYHLIKHTSASFVSISTYICPIVAIFLGNFFLSEQLAWNVYLGATIIFISIFIINSNSNSSTPSP